MLQRVCMWKSGDWGKGLGREIAHTTGIKMATWIGVILVTNTVGDAYSTNNITKCKTWQKCGVGGGWRTCV